MAKGTIPEGGFEKAEQLEAWLQTLTFRNNRGFGQILASRSAIRTMPNSEEIFKSARNLSEWRFEFLTSLFHHNLILLIHLKETNETKIRRLKTVYEFMISSNQHVFMKINSYFAAANHAAASTVYAGGESPIDTGLPPIEVLKSIDYSVRSFRSAVRSKKKTSNTIRIAGYFAWAAVTADARMLEAGATPAEMAATPLWPAGSPYKPTFDRKTFLAAAPSFEVWLDWYEPIALGKAPWGLPRDVADKLEMRIALGDDRGEGGKDFWGRDADVVNAEIKGWVEEARAEAALMHQPAELEIEKQTTGALQFDGNINEPISLKSMVAGQDWAIDEGSRERHAEARRLADKLINLCNGKHAGNNALAEFKEEFEFFSLSLGETLESLNPNLVVPRGDGLRKTLNEYANLDDFSKLDPLPNDVLLRANQVIAAYNQFVALDTQLALRDEALFGPDARKRLVAPIEGQPIIANAVQNGVAKPEVLEATAAEAKVAPIKPNPENRTSRRYSEGQKNFGRQAIANAVEYVRNNPIETVSVVGGPPVSGFIFAQWVWQNQDMLLSWFASNPTMTNVLGWLLHYLAKIFVP
jgi:hypothetical protein